MTMTMTAKDKIIIIEKKSEIRKGQGLKSGKVDELQLPLAEAKRQLINSFLNLQIAGVTILYDEGVKDFNPILQVSQEHSYSAGHSLKIRSILP